MSKHILRKLQQSYAELQTARQEAYVFSQEALRLSKQAIFYLHENKHKEASHALRDAEKRLKKLQKIWRTFDRIRYEGSTHAALEEYAEAKTYYVFVEKGRINEVKDFEVSDEEYIGGLADVTGELVRRVVMLATNHDGAGVDFIHGTVETIVEHLLGFHLTGHLRQKFDDAKRNLHKIEDIRYQLKRQ